MAEMAKKIVGYRFSNHSDLAVMATRGVNRSSFTDWIIDEPKPKDFIVPSFRKFDGKTDPMDHIFHFQ